jgi:hypothetical protein
MIAPATRDHKNVFIISYSTRILRATNRRALTIGSGRVWGRYSSLRAFLYRGAVAPDRDTKTHSAQNTSPKLPSA